jgi:hypothetical protein
MGRVAELGSNARREFALRGDSSLPFKVPAGGSGLDSIRDERGTDWILFEMKGERVKPREQGLDGGYAVAQAL